MPKTIISKIQQNPDLLRDRNANKKGKKKKVKYKKITLKITESQNAALQRLCKKNKTTTVRYIKSIINNSTVNYKTPVKEKNYVTENQLSLFDFTDE